MFSVEIFKALFLTLELCGGDAPIGDECHDFVDTFFDINLVKDVFGTFHSVHTRILSRGLEKFQTLAWLKKFKVFFALQRQPILDSRGDASQSATKFIGSLSPMVSNMSLATLHRCI